MTAVVHALLIAKSSPSAIEEVADHVDAIAEPYLSLKPYGPKLAMCQIELWHSVAVVASTWPDYSTLVARAFSQADAIAARWGSDSGIGPDILVVQRKIHAVRHVSAPAGVAG